MAAKKTSTSARSRSTSSTKRSGSSSTRSTAKKATGSGSSRSRSGTGRKTTSKTKSASTSGSAGRRTRANAVEKEFIDYSLYYEIFLWVVIALSILLFISMLGLGGSLGKAVRGVLFGMFGIMGYVFPFALCFLTAFLISNGSSRIARIKSFGVLFLFITLCGMFQIVLVGYEKGYRLADYYAASAQLRTGGGWVGGALTTFFAPAIGSVGAYIVYLIMMIIALILITQRSLFEGVKKGGSNILENARAGRERRREWMAMQRERREEERAQRMFDDDSDTLYDPALDDEVDDTDSFHLLPSRPRKDRKVTGVTKDTKLLPELTASDAAGDVLDEDEDNLTGNHRKKADKNKNVKAASAAHEGSADLSASDEQIEDDIDRLFEGLRMKRQKQGGYQDTDSDDRQSGTGKAKRTSSDMDAFADLGKELGSADDLSDNDGSSRAERETRPRKDKSKSSRFAGIGSIFRSGKDIGRSSSGDAVFDGSTMPEGDPVQERFDADEDDFLHILPREDRNRGGRAGAGSAGSSRSGGSVSGAGRAGSGAMLGGSSGRSGASGNTAGGGSTRIGTNGIPGSAQTGGVQIISEAAARLMAENAQGSVGRAGAAGGFGAGTAGAGGAAGGFGAGTVGAGAAGSSAAGAGGAAGVGGAAGASGADASGTAGGSRKKHASEAEINASVQDVAAEIAQNEAPKPEYIFPPTSLLALPTRGKQGTSEEDLKSTAAKLQKVFQTFNVNVKITDVTCGPSVTRYELMPEMGVKVSKIVSLQDDIKLNLAVTDIRIEAPIPGKAAVGIEVPNKHATGVLLRELLESPEFKNHKSNLAYVVGKDIAGNIIVSDIARMPHLLIAGATGSGKSVFINTLVMSILYKAKPEDVKLIMIDPKVVELSVYNGIPHLFIPVVTDPKKAAGALNWAVAEMMARYQKFAENGVRDLKGYNARVAALGDDVPEETKPAKMPQIIIIVDELADLMMVASSEVEDAICRLAQLARAAGIHLVIATQRPSVDVITGLIKANMPSRIAFSVSSGVDSRTILDSVGAEKLLGNGDMLFYPQTFKQPLRVQGAFISDSEVAAIVDNIKENNADGADADAIAKRMEAVEKSSAGGQGAGGGGGSDVDELFAEAGKFIIEKDKASIGMLQRWFKIGFNRAARIMDQLSDAGVVGPDEGTKPRKVEMSMEQFEEYLENN